MTPADLFLANRALIERLIGFTAARQRLSRVDREEFASFVWVRLIENDYHILRQFSERSLLKTYLTTVILRLLYDYRIAQWGKWRPSAQAQRLGPLAVQLERLLTRDRLTREEAFEQLQASLPEPPARDELDALAAQLPPRIPRTTVSEEALANVPAASPAPDAGVLAAERAELAARAIAALRVALAELDDTTRSVMVLRYNGGLSVPRIAAMLQIEAKPLYRLMDQVREKLRATLEAAGISAADVQELLSDPDSTRPQGEHGRLTIVRRGGGRSRPSN